MIPHDQQWLSVKQVAAAFGHDEQWVRDAIAKGRSNRAGTFGIPASKVMKVGGSLHIHRSFVYTLEDRSNLVAFPAPITDSDKDDIADRVVARLLTLVAERIGQVAGKVA